MQLTIEGVTVITGGASGIGEACVRVLAAAGARIVIIDRDERRGKTVANEVVGHAFVADVADERQMIDLAAHIEETVGPVRTLVNSAGVLQMPVPPHEMSMADWDDVVRVDQRGTYVASVAFAKAMLAHRTGAIINIASIAGMRAMPLHAYAPAKAAVISMTACLAAEWGPFGVRVNAVSPGYTRTPALQERIDKGERDPSAMQSNAALGRLVEPRDIGNAVAFLASPLASAITGISLPVDAGWLVATPWHTYGGLRHPPPER